ncbi:MAG: helix-turn-helix transcriptional regulator [Chthoniobacteraceae bacterium]
MTLHRWASLRTELIWIYEGPIHATHQKATFDHSQGYWIWLFKQGSGSVEMNGETWHAKTGQWMASPQGVVTQNFSDDAHILSVHFRCEWPTGESLFPLSGGWIFDAEQFPRLERSGSSLRRLIHRFFPDTHAHFSLETVDYFVFFKFQRLFVQWLKDFFDTWLAQGNRLTKAGECDDRLLRCVRFLNEAPFEEGFPGEILERESGLGRAHLDRLFWKQFSITTREYWEKRRTEAATQSLQMIAIPIKEICYQLGFKQSSHFTKWFTHRVGMTPRAYRERGFKNWL